MDISRIDDRASRDYLQVFGCFHPRQDDGLPEETGTLVMLGPLEPGFWKHMTEQPEFGDGISNPMDRWSTRAIDSIAEDVGATSYYPFGGPPYHPFYGWAIRTGRCWKSPVQFLVHDKAGLFVSYRGALAFAEVLELPDAPGESPCETCPDRPCETACPVEALTTSRYDADGCRTFVGSKEGKECLERGCEVRRICPVSAKFARSEEQSRFHQEAFLRAVSP